MNIHNLGKYEKKQIYIATMRPVLNKRALFSDATSQYLSPMEPNAGEEVTVRFRTGKDNVDAVKIITTQGDYPMKKCETNDVFDYYEGKFVVGEETIRYYFQVKSGALNCYFNKLGVTKHIEPYYAFSIYPGFHTPDWAKGAVIYQIFVDRFCNGDKTNDVVDTNGGEVAGLAGRFTEKLAGEGFRLTDPTTYHGEQVDYTRIQVKADGAGKDLVKYFDKARVEAAPSDMGSADIRIILGTNEN